MCISLDLQSDIYIYITKMYGTMNIKLNNTLYFFFRLMCWQSPLSSKPLSRLSGYDLSNRKLFSCFQINPVQSVLYHCRHTDQSKGRTTEETSFDYRQIKEMFFTKAFRPTLEPIQRGKAAETWSLGTQYHLVPRLRTSALPSLLYSLRCEFVLIDLFISYGN
jgi:hypothetical protein